VEKILSIVVPAYQSENCLKKCVSSLLATGSVEKLDIIVVDDGSTDQTGEIADQFAREHPNSISAIHKENGGHGSGINVAIQKARGRFFRVVDADDWLLTENIPAYLEELESCTADVVINGFHRVRRNGRCRVPVEAPLELLKKTWPMAKLTDKWTSLRNCFTIHGITYRRECYLASKVCLTEKTFYEDNEYTTLPFCQVEQVYFSPLFLYQYSVGDQAQSVSDKNQVLRFDQMERVLFRICDRFQTDPSFAPANKRRYLLEKIYTMVSTCLITCLLRNTDRSSGRRRASALMGRLAEEFPEVCQRCAGQYQRLRWFHALHLRGKMLDNLLDSGFYLTLRKQLRK